MDDIIRTIQTNQIEGKLQDIIGERLAEEGIKTKPGTKLRKDSGGSRTWIVGPKIFGLCFEEEETRKMEFTDCGNTVAKGGRNAIARGNGACREGLYGDN